MSDPNKRFLEIDYGYQQIIHHDPLNPDDLIIEDRYDVEPIIEEAKRLSELTPGKEFRHVGVIPLHVMAQAYREGWNNDQAKWKEWMNDADNKVFRTWPGRL